MRGEDCLVLHQRSGAEIVQAMKRREEHHRHVEVEQQVQQQQQQQQQEDAAEDNNNNNNEEDGKRMMMDDNDEGYGNAEEIGLGDDSATSSSSSTSGYTSYSSSASAAYSAGAHAPTVPGTSGHGGTSGSNNINYNAPVLGGHAPAASSHIPNSIINADQPQSRQSQPLSRGGGLKRAGGGFAEDAAAADSSGGDDMAMATTTTPGGNGNSSSVAAGGGSSSVNKESAPASGSSSGSGTSGRGPQHEMEEQRILNEEVAFRAERKKNALLARLVNAAPRGRLSLINLSRRNLGVLEANMLREAIASNPHLSVLKLSYNYLGDEGAAVVASALQVVPQQQNEQQLLHHHPTLSVLDLGFNDIGDAGCDALAVHAVAGNFNLRILYLSGNRFGPKGAVSIAGAILHGTGLSSLHLSANNICSMGMKAIAGAITKNDIRIATLVSQQQQKEDGGLEGLVGEAALIGRVEELHLGSTGIDSSGFISIPGMLLSNSSLRVLCLSNNNLDDNDMVLLSQALSQNKSIPLEFLSLSFNEITCQGVECLMNALWGSQTLRELRLDNNMIQDRGAQLCAVVLTSISLETLDLAFNSVTTLGIKAIMKNLSENSTLRSLGLCGIPIDQNASKAVSYALAYNTSLNALFVDNCSMGYSSQRHIVAGIVSNRRLSLRVLTGFPIGPVARTLGMPNIPERWTNDQVLGFFRLMWQQWLLKAGRGAGIPEDACRGPGPPAAVAAAAKIALSALGSSPESLFHTEPHEKTVAEGAPVDPCNTALLERTDSGTMRVPSFSHSLESEGDELLEMDSKITDMTPAASSNPSTVRGPLENPERRNRNLQWLRVHFRSLNEVGRLPFNNADLWQLHQYYFSPPFCLETDVDKPLTDAEDANEEESDKKESPGYTVVPPPTPAVGSKSSSLGRAVSFQTLGDAFAASGMFPPPSSHKRRSIEEGDGPVAKRAKSLSKPRIAYYPRVMAKIQSLGAKPMEQSLSLLRQLKYTENIIFSCKDPYIDAIDVGPNEPSHADLEMILLDLL